MGKLVDGKWLTSQEMRDQDIDESKISGGVTGWLVAEGEEAPAGHKAFPAEKDRYILYISLGCPFASRAAMAYQLKGLDQVMDLVIVNPKQTEKGWSFAKGDRVDKDPVMDADYLHEIFIHADPNYTGPVTVPLLYDKKTEQIVSTESVDLVKMFDTAFAKMLPDTISLYPEGQEEAIADAYQEMLQPVVFGVYAAERMDKQKKYENVVKRLFRKLDAFEERLEKQAYLCGEYFTAADIFLFVTLIRFDAVYYTLFLCNLKQIKDYPHLLAWLKRIYNMDGIKETVDFNHIKELYYLNPEDEERARIPLGPDMSYLDEEA